ncbi:MAG: DUF4442 domain-containing protein [Flavobacteriales bacterium]
MNLPGLLLSARTSGFRRWVLNMGLQRMIPFNRPHGLNVVPLESGGIKVLIPFWRINQNHIRGIHACCLATAAEYCSGLALMAHLDAKSYRIIMKSLHMEYHYQAKSAASAVFSPSAEEVETNIRKVVERGEAVLYVADVPVHDDKGNHLATGRITWQVKPWESVRTAR